MDAQKLCADLNNGLHAMAQPLTVLRAAIEMLSLPRDMAIDRERYLETAAVQIGRTCALFLSVQDLVSARLVAPSCMRLDLRELTAPLIEHQRLSFEALGIGIAVRRGASWLPVWGDAERTEQAVTAALRTAAQVSSRGDVIELIAAPECGFMQLTLLNTRSHGERVSSSDRLELSLAEVNILSQRGRYAFADDPFRVSLAWPLDGCDVAGTHAEDGGERGRPPN